MSKELEARRKSPAVTQKQTRIVFFATQLYALASGRSSGFGGAETELWNVANGLASNPSNVVRTLTLTDEIDKPAWFQQVKLYPVRPAPNLTYNDSWLKRRMAILGYFTNLYKQLRNQKADIYFSKLASSEASAVWLASRRAGAKFVFRVEHDWETNSDDLTNIIFRGSKFWAKTFIHCLKRADLIIAQSQKQVDALKANYGVEAIIIANGHNIPDLNAIDHNPQNRKSVLWVARAHPMKRPHLFLDLAEQLPQFKFIMIMAPSSEHTELFEKCVSRANELPNVNFHPGVAPDAVDEFYRNARLFVLTSEAEGFSNVIIEALKNGAPTLSLGHNPNDMLAKVHDPEELLVASGFYTDNSMEVSAAILERMFQDDGFWENCHCRAYKIAAETFGLEHVVAQYENEFDRLLNT